MERQDAIKTLVRLMLKELPEEVHGKIVESWFLMGFEPGDDAIQQFSVTLRKEICAGVIPDDLLDKKYDPLVLEDLTQNFIGVKNQYLQKKLRAYGIKSTKIEGEPEALLACPCCGYYTLPVQGGYSICGVCFWEDDGQHSDPLARDLENASLVEAKHNFKKHGASNRVSPRFVDADAKFKYSKAN